MHQGCVRSRQRRRGGRGTWWRTWPSWPWVARATIFAATGRAVLAAHQAGVAEATAYLNEHLGRAAAMVDISMWTAGLLAVGFDHRTSGRAIRCCTPIWWWPTAPGPQ
jgi:hypothetical protein